MFAFQCQDAKCGRGRGLGVRENSPYLAMLTRALGLMKQTIAHYPKGCPLCYN